MAAEVTLTIQFMVTVLLPKTTVVAAGVRKVPFCAVPLVNVAAVLAVRVSPTMSSVPLVRVKLLMVVVAFSWQVWLPVTMVTLSAAPGIPLGVQLPAVFQEEESDPFQV